MILLCWICFNGCSPPWSYSCLCTTTPYIHQSSFFFVAASSVLIPVSQPIEASAGTGSCTPAQPIAKASEKKRASRTGTAISYSPLVLMTWVYLLCSMKFVQKSWIRRRRNTPTTWPIPMDLPTVCYIHCSGISPQPEKLPEYCPEQIF